MKWNATDEIENKIQLVKGKKIKRMTKFDIKIKLNQMIREKIELKEDKKTKQIVIKRI